MRLAFDAQANTLRLTLDTVEGAVARSRQLPAVIDVAGEGRLIGLEVRGLAAPALARWHADPIAGEWLSRAGDGSVYLQLTTGDDPAERAARSSDLRISAEFDASDRLLALAIPRRGHGYEISYPSGNR